MTAPLRVVKLGGSLLDWPEWPARFQRWLAEQPPAANVLIVGGGAQVDVVRGWDRTHRLSKSTSHWLAIRAMSVTAELAAELLPAARLVRDLRELERSGSSVQVLDVYTLLASEAASDLPHGWNVTSDSIAALVARVISAQELVLLKSTSRPENLVDGHFADASQGLNVRMVNLRTS